MSRTTKGKSSKYTSKSLKKWQSPDQQTRIKRDILKLIAKKKVIVTFTNKPTL